MTRNPELSNRSRSAAHVREGDGMAPDKDQGRLDAALITEDEATTGSLASSINRRTNRPRPFDCVSAVERRRREWAALKAEIDDAYPPRPPDPPSTFGLTERQLARHARQLVASGWSRSEVAVVLDLRGVKW
jgi:hypothetical protein